MKYLFLSLVLLCALAAASLCQAASEPARPVTFLISPDHYLSMRQTIQNAPEPWMKTALDSLRGEAEKAMSKGPWSVMDKNDTQLPPSGDKHDFYSLSIYWWETPDGTWVWRDGERNPASILPDEAGLQQLFSTVKILSNAAWFLDEPRYGEKAASLLRHWFLDPETAMNPNLNFAGAIPGKSTGRGVGIHRFKDFAFIIDAIGLLHAMGVWSDKDQENMRQWVGKFAEWANTSKLGLDEKKALNNHSVFYGSMMLASALYTENEPLIKEYLESYFQKQLITQIAKDGNLPQEMKRTHPIHYFTYTLMGFGMYAETARNLGVDYYDFVGPDGQTLRAAFNYLLPYWEGKTPWPKKEDPMLDYRVFITARLGALRLNEPAFETYLETSFPTTWARDYRNLLWPPPATVNQGE